MNEKIKTFCLLLIAISLLLIANNYIQELTIEKEKLNLELKKYKLESCIEGGRYVTIDNQTGGTFNRFQSEWWVGRWNFEKEECEKEEGKYGNRNIKVE